MNWKFDCAKVPNRLIMDTMLHYSARQLGCTLYAIHKSGTVTKSLSKLSRISGIGSVATVRKDLNELQDAGYILSREQRYRQCGRLGRKVYDTFSYRLDMSFTGGYTLIPKSLLRACRGQYSVFAVAAYICMEMGNEERAFPSLKQIAKALGDMAISTVCRAVKALDTASVMYVKPCIRRNKTHASNSYFLLKSLPERNSRREGYSLLFIEPTPSLPSCNYYRSVNHKMQQFSARRDTSKISRQRT